MPRISVELDEELLKKIERRAKLNFFSTRELIEDIIRRSMTSYRGGRTRFKCDDRLVGMFSREKRGRKKKKVKKKK